ncbi:hypothetical protein N7450_008519 [Penicillium hetheringtonii]|uniref:Uncharacterized protein n=1 Tax=Penicillium hetheringtonii TaxID=911720 RepID=A0AAD6GMJ0_9EURO|nr:hypothetical protein N7450_008519 [Penicillium hetheringtonii]
MSGQTRVDPVLKTDEGGWGPDRSPTPPRRGHEPCGHALESYESADKKLYENTKIELVYYIYTSVSGDLVRRRSVTDQEGDQTPPTSNSKKKGGSESYNQRGRDKEV